MMKKNYIFIAILVILLIAAGFYIDKSAKINLNTGQNENPRASSSSTENSTTTSTASKQSNSVSPIKFPDYGPAPDFKTGDNWLNSSPLKMADLKGKVVLIDFWTYSCINCIRTLPYVTKWYDTYKDKGFVVVGVHTPEFTFEQDAGNVANAIAQFGIHYPVVQDNDYSIWNSYNNQYWPAEYLINQKGEIVEEHFGEGNYDETENNIRELLGLNATSSAANSQDLSSIGSPEMYFGTDRLQNLTPSQNPSSSPADYSINKNVSLNNFSLGGRWQFAPGNATLTGTSGEIDLKFHSAKIYMVASSQNPANLQITVDGKPQKTVTVQDAKLYTLFDSEDYSDHIIEIKIDQSGFEAFTFTFG